jgi:hypothetical protein
VVTPAGNVLVEDLTLRVETGSNLLITGNPLLPNDCHLTSPTLAAVNTHSSKLAMMRLYVA